MAQINIAGTLHNTEEIQGDALNSHVVAHTNEILDSTKEKKQSEVNADVDTALADRYTKEETYSKSQLDNLITTPDVQYVSVTATAQTTAVTDVLPATGAADTVYRVGSWDGSAFDAGKYSEYAWNGTAYQLLAVRSGSINGVFDISVYKASGGTPTQYADLAAALGSSGANVPENVRAGGMQVRFINSSTGKYKQCRLMAASWSTTVTDWQDVDETPTAGSQNLVTSGGVKEEIDDVNRILEGLTLNFIKDISSQRMTGYKITTNTYSVGDIVDFSPETQSNIDCMVVEVVKDELFIITGKGGTAPRSFAWTDKDKKFISASDNSTNELSNDILQAPSDGYLILNALNNNSSFPISWKKVINTLGNGNKYRATNGGIANLNKYFYTVPIKVNVGDVVDYPYAISDQISAITKVAQDGSYISVLKAGTSGQDVGEYTITEECYISISLNSSKIDNVEVTIKGVVTALGVLSTEVGVINEGLSVLSNSINDIDAEINTEISKIVNEGTGQNLLGQLISDAWIKDGDEEYKEDYHATEYIKIKSGVPYYYNNVYRGYYAFYDSSKMLLSYANTVSTDSPDRLALPFYAPTNAMYVRLTINSALDYTKSWLNTRDEEPIGVPFIELTEEVVEGTGIPKNEKSGLVFLTSNPLGNIVRCAGYGGIIHSWGIVGDSLASGEMQCYDNTSASASDYKFIDMYQWSWGQRFAKLNAVDCYNFSNGGQTTWGWLKDQGVVHDSTHIGGIGGGDWRLAQQSDYLKDGYIIALGVNDRSKIVNGDYTLGDVEDIITYTGNSDDIDDTTSSPKSFVRYYAGIIQRLKSVRPKCKIFCVTPIGDNYTAIAQAIRDIVDYYTGSDVYLIDLYTYYPVGWSGTMYNMNGHGSAIGYEYLAYCINTYIDWIIRNNGNSFKATALIGLENYREKYSE